jgi:4-amino-4-deoxy-L-arabinose transferase-like glycosyltransferase
MSTSIFALPRPAVIAAVTALLAVIVVQLALMANANSATFDEPDHIYSAYMQTKYGDFGLNPEHPPLIKYLGALPILNMRVTLPPMQDRFYRLQEADGGRAFLFDNDANAILWRVRMATSIITLLLALLVFLAAQEMFGVGAGLIALALIAFDPTLLAHSALMTTDAGGTCFMFAAVYAFYRYVKSPTIVRLAITGLAVGLALCAKHSGVLLLPILVLLSFYEIVRGKPGPNDEGSNLARRSLQFAAALLVVAVMGIAILWASYGFRYKARPDGLTLNPTVAAQFAHVPSPFEGHVLATMAQMHLLPESYLYGWAHILAQSGAFTSFLLGTIYPHPVWFYFPVAMVIKSTLTFLILLTITKWMILTGKLSARREILYMAIPAVVYLLFAMAGGMNIGVRHVLPVYIFVSVLIGGAMWQLVQRNRRWLYVVMALLIFQAISVVHSYPAYISYANEAFGGPSHAHDLLSDSSSDWGQQLKSVKRYIDAHGIKDCWFSYFGQGVVDYRYYGIPCKTLITADSLFFDGPHDVPPAIDGPVFMSAGVLSGFEFGPGPLNAYEQFKSIKPVAVIDNGVFVYEGHFDIPLAAALSHMQKAGLLLGEHKTSDALAEAEQAESLAPTSASVNVTMARALDANDRSGEAKPYYEKALALAQSNEPSFQQGLIKQVQSRLAYAMQQDAWNDEPAHRCSEQQCHHAKSIRYQPCQCDAIRFAFCFIRGEPLRQPQRAQEEQQETDHGQRVGDRRHPGQALHLGWRERARACRVDCHGHHAAERTGKERETSFTIIGPKLCHGCYLKGKSACFFAWHRDTEQRTPPCPATRSKSNPPARKWTGASSEPATH